jgi:coatomer protein complex subunit epsilon
VLNTLLGKREEVKGLKEKLAGVDAEHRMLKDWEEKKSEFERARTKYTPKFEVTA